MRPARIQELLHKQIKKTATAASTISPTFLADDIHQFRVGVKKLRAIVRFINSVKGQPTVKLTKKFNTCYRIAGTLRDAHLKYDTLTQRGLHLTQYYSNLSMIVIRNKGEWNKTYSGKVMHKLDRRISELNFDDLAPQDLVHFFERNIGKIKKMNDSTPDDELIHKMRKIIKDLLYISQFARKNWPAGYDLVAQFPHQDLIDVANLVGHFNDGSILLWELASFSSMGIEHEEQTAIAQFVEGSMTRHKTLRKDLIKQIKAFVEDAELALK